MNREFTPTSRRVRSILAVVAVVATALVVGSIEGLSKHYSADAQLASAKTAVIARH